MRQWKMATPGIAGEKSIYSPPKVGGPKVVALLCAMAQRSATMSYKRLSLSCSFFLGYQPQKRIYQVAVPQFLN
jgi:hypothetical protein